MLINCCSWFIENIWLTISEGSIGLVGSCDCNSVTSKLIKVLSAWLAAWFASELEDPAAAVELVELVELVEAVELSGFIRASGEIVATP